MLRCRHPRSFLQGLKPCLLRLLDAGADSPRLLKIMSDLKVRPPKEKSDAPELVVAESEKPQVIHGSKNECVNAFSLGGRGFQPRLKAEQRNRALAPETKLLRGYQVCSEVVRSRVQPPNDSHFANKCATAKKSTETGFETKTMWSDFNEARNRNDFQG